MAPPQLRFAKIAAGRPYHSALVIQRGAYGEGTLLHTHDFWEMMYVFEGTGTHLLHGEPMALAVGDILLLRPKDVHAVQAAPGQRLHFFNIAFAEGTWRDFCVAARLEVQAASWAASVQPFSVRVPATHQETCTAAFRRALHAFIEGPSYLDLCGFWSAALPLLFQKRASANAKVAAPAWLGYACQMMHEETNLRAGLPRLTTLSGVSQAHLARTLKHHYGQTPTEYVNELRLKRAATLLSTTARAVTDIADDCGFENLSYFYRRFTARFGSPPRAFRLGAGREVVP